VIRRRGAGTVAALLRDLPVPEHADDFFDRLKARLSAESDADVAPPSSAVVDLSVRRAVRQRELSSRQRFLRSATAPAAAVACFVLVVGVAQLARTTHENSARDADAAAPDFTAGKMQRFVLPQTYEPAKTGLRVRFTASRSGAVDVESYDAVMSPTGDYHISRVAPKAEVSFSADSGVRTMYREEIGKPTEGFTEDDLPLGPPEAPEFGNPTGKLFRDLGAAVRAMAAEPGTRVHRTQWNGRPALELTDEGGGGTLFDKQYLLVDEKTAIPVQLMQWKAGKVVYTLAVDEIRDEPLTSAALAPTLPQQATTPIRVSKHFVPTTLADAALKVNYKPLVPLWLPPGYALAKVAAAPTVPSGDVPTMQVYADVVTMVYRRGFDSFTVSTRRAAPGSGSAAWTDPLTRGTPLPDRSESIAIESGALAGDPVHVGIYPVVWPHVWAQHGDLLVTIAGDLNREELLRVARSLQAYVAP
jgi:hypothetical protein